MSGKDASTEWLGKPLLAILAGRFGVSEAALTEIAQSENLKDELVTRKLVNFGQLAEAYRLQTGLPLVNQFDTDAIPEELITLLPISFSKQHRVLPLAINSEGKVLLAVADPLELSTFDQLRLWFGRDLELQIAPTDLLLTAINQAYDRALRQAESAVAELEEVSDDLRGDLEEEVVDLLDAEGDDEAPIIRLVNSLMSQAVKDGASDIHVEPFERELVVRFRVDGILYEIIRPPKRFQNSIISRVKIMAGLNIAEKRLPQDGRIRLKVAGKDIDIRVSSVPTGYGERIVMRLLYRSSVLRDLTDMGFNEKNLKVMNKLITSSHGIILVSGPTGSGKTSTLYACLAKINEPTLNILTIEDPVEYQLAGIGQVQVNTKIDLTFASGLRAFLRQDPDVIMVGEIRDRETAEIAIQASLTGHLVFSTIHTNDAPGAVTRLVDMHVEPFLVASSLMAVVAQRLVRTICPQCREQYVPTKEELKEIGIEQHVPHLWRGKGCTHCQSTGYKGRVGIYEMMLVEEQLRQLILQNVDAGTLKTKAREHGMVTLREDGAQKVLDGVTTIEEVTRVTREETIAVE